MHSLLVYFAKEEGGGVSLETEGLDQLKRLFIQLPRENVNVLKYLRCVCVCMYICAYVCACMCVCNVGCVKRGVCEEWGV